MTTKEGWKCTKGCKASKCPCPHLEKLLPSMESGAFISDSVNVKQQRIRLFGNFDRVNTQDDEYDQETLETFEKHLDKYKLSGLERKILKHKFFYNETLREIAESLHTPLRKIHTVYTKVIKRIGDTNV